MGFQEDFDRFAEAAPAGKKTKKDYLRKIWDETTLQPEAFDEIYLLDDHKAIRQAALAWTAAKGADDFRQKMYARFLYPQNNDAFPIWLDELTQLVPDAAEKKVHIARYLTRALRGEGCAAHTQLQAARRLLKEQGLNVWENCFDQFKQRCDALGI